MPRRVEATYVELDGGDALVDTGDDLLGDPVDASVHVRFSSEERTHSMGSTCFGSRPKQSLLMRAVI